MTIWSCTVFQVNPACEAEAERLLTETGQEYVYDTWDTENLTLFIGIVRRGTLGKLVEIQLDRMSPPLHARGRPPQRIRVTANLAMQLFDVRGWPRLVGVFGRSANVTLFRQAFAKIYRAEIEPDKTPIFRIGFQLREREEELLQRFPDMKQLRVDSIQDVFVSSATLKGDSLEESPEYQSWVLDRDRGGIVRYFGVQVRDETVILSTKGSMYSRQGREKHPVRTVYEILSSLMDCQAIIYSPTLDSFTQHSSA